MAHSNAVALHNRLFAPSCNPTTEQGEGHSHRITAASSKDFLVNEVELRYQIGELFQSLKAFALQRRNEETKEIRSRSSRRKTCFRTSAAEEEEMMENHIGLCQRVYDTCGSDVEILIKDDEDPNSSKIIALASCQANLRVNLIEGPSST
jgi:hypothetical protein